MNLELKELARKRTELESVLRSLDAKERDLCRRTGILEEKLEARQLEREANAESGEVGDELRRIGHAALVLSSAGNDETRLFKPSKVIETPRGTERRVRLNRKTVFSWSYKELF